MHITDHTSYFLIRFPYGTGSWFARNMAAVKAIPGHSWNREKKYWWIPGSGRNQVLALVKTHKAILLSPGGMTPEMMGEIPPMPDLTIDIPLRAELRHYQRQGVARAIQCQKVLIGDDMGLGKSFEAIAAVIAQNAFPCLVVCPSTLKINWQREWEKFSDFKAAILTDKIKNTWHKYYEIGQIQVFIVNYESLKKYFVHSMPTRVTNSSQIIMKPEASLFKSVIFDEIHRCKNSSGQRARFSMRLAQGRAVRIGLTGTPVINKPKDLFPVLSILGRLEHFGGTKTAFMNRYCEGGEGKSNLGELNFLLQKHCFFRREKKDVLTELPAKVRQTIVCDITNREEYTKAQLEYDDWLTAQGKTEQEIMSINRALVIQKMMSLKEVSAKGKLEAVREWVEEIMDGDNKVILFCNLHEIVDRLLEIFPGAVTLTGRDSDTERQIAIDRFQKYSDVKIIICNIKTGGVGVNLTAASYVGFMEYPWHPADCWQCEDRAHRIGQDKTVFATYFLGQATIDERLWEIIKDKTDVANQITGASDQMETEFIDKTVNLFNQTQVSGHI